MDIIARYNGESELVNLADGAKVSSLRGHSVLEELGAPSSFKFAVGGQQVNEDHVLSDGDVVTFRPVEAEKGA